MRIAEEPFCPFEKNSSAHALGFLRCRISVANFSKEQPRQQVYSWILRDVALKDLRE